MPISVLDSDGVETSLSTPEELSGDAITGQSLESGGSGSLGWLSSIRKAITDRLPAALGAGGGIKVDGSGTALPISGTITANAGTGTLATSLSSLPALAAGTNNIGDVDIVGGTIAEDASDSTNPIGIGGRASVALPTAMSADGDRVKAWFDRLGALFVRERPSDSVNVSNVTAATSDTSLISSNTARLGLIIHNDSTAGLKLKYGTGSSSTSYTVSLAAGDHWEMGKTYRGAINGIWTAANGAARITELV